MAPLIVDHCNLNALESILAEYANTDMSIDIIFGKLTMETIVAAAFGCIIDVQRGERDELVNAAKEITSEGREFSAERLNVLIALQLPMCNTHSTLLC